MCEKHFPSEKFTDHLKVLGKDWFRKPGYYYTLETPLLQLKSIDVSRLQWVTAWCAAGFN